MGFTWRPFWVYKRNALIVLGNIGDEVAYDRLIRLSHFLDDEKLADYYNWAKTHIEMRKQAIAPICE